MSSSLEFVQYVAEQLSQAGEITWRRMFGEYGLYCDGIFFGTVEDNGLYVKITPAGEELLGHPEVASPHEGAKFYAVEELEDRVFLGKLIRATCAQLPPPKPRRAKGTGGRP
ncbi:MAG: TfoX/Sxy family protein [Eubacteriales bacterium]|jgi:TfoX/Sxy family transcriptional regulator of competence genes